MSRAEVLRKMQPQLVADVVLYPTEAGGRRGPAYLGWGCPCMISKMHPLVGYDGWPLIGEEPLQPGDHRRLGFVFLTPDGLEALGRAKRFYLWESGFIGEASVVSGPAA